jgi:8-amino-7-oxononanoate synthase
MSLLRMLADIQKLENSGKLRSLSLSEPLIDFSSNDYLGLAKTVITVTEQTAGSTGSRLISGNTEQLEHFENEFAQFVGAESALFFANGYLANAGLFSCIATRKDTIIYDQFVHASIRDGLSLSNSRSFGFKHNCLEDLEKKLAISTGETFVVVESVYSMDGDSPDLIKLIDLCEKYHAHLIVDEAHGMGCIGDNGKGLSNTLAPEKDIFARIFPLGKAFGMEGAFIAGSAILRNYLINFSRPFIFTTGPAPFKVTALREQFTKYKAIDFNNQHPTLRMKELLIKNLTSQFELSYGKYGNIVMVIIPGNDQVMIAAEYLQQKGFFIKGIRSPTVPIGREGLRICIHTYNTEEEIKSFCNHLMQYHHLL